MRKHTVLHAAALALLAVAGCRRETPEVGAPIVPPAKPTPGIQISIGSPRLDLGRVVVPFAVVQDGVRLTGPEVEALELSWTLAALGTQPVDGAPAWWSLLPTGGQTLPRLPVAGPETPPEHVRTDVVQPGVDEGGTYVDNGLGTITYTYGAALPASVTAATTLRVGVFLPEGAVGPETTAVKDFRGDRGAVGRREVVLDAACNRCHGTVRAHEGTRSGTQICVTCHTWQHADRDTVDPAALAGATPSTDPNPLELGRLVHRIHRGKNLPTLYLSSTQTPFGPPPFAADFAAAPKLPFLPGRNAPAPGQRFSVVGELSRERVFARIEARDDNGMPAKTMAAGLTYPRDLRDCDACHAGAADGAVVETELSRRSCQGCHPDVWFGEGATDATHFPHTGGARASDAECGGCHGALGTYVRIADAHRPLYLSPDHWDGPVASIVDVQGLKAPPADGSTPPPIVVSFTLADRHGPVSPLGAPTPLSDPAYPVSRALARVALTLAGPTAPDYGAPGNANVSESVPLTCSADPAVPCAARADANGVFRYTMTAKLPAGATGTWAVSLEARRANSAPRYYDDVADAFPWPYTRENVYETANNPVAYVDVASGLLDAGAPVARRQVVSQEKCEACHQRVSLHGDLRHAVAYCIMCHTADKTDWARRPKNPDGSVNLSANRSSTSSEDYGTYDGLEERTVHFKVMIHRIHTGARRGRAELSAIQPHVVYGNPGANLAVPGSNARSAYFLDEGEYPNDLANCKVCHLPGTYALEAVPADAPPTVANESPTVLHGAARAHATGAAGQHGACASVPALTAACLGCHATAYAIDHAERYTVDGEESCASCHGASAASGVGKVHGVVEPPE